MTEKKHLLPGTFVRYTIKNELGLIGEIRFNGARCWQHNVGTRSMSPYELIEPFTLEEVLSETFSNEYAKASLIERSLRIQEGGDVSDLIDDRTIRDEVKYQVQQGK